MSNVITRTFIGTNVNMTVVNKETMSIEFLNWYLDGAYVLGKELDKAIIKDLATTNYTFVTATTAEPCNKTLSMSVTDFMKYATEIETRDVKGFRERSSKSVDKKDTKKK